MKNILAVEKIIDEAKIWGFTLTKKQALLLQKYQLLLLKENKKYNLTRILNPADMLEQLFFDSLAGYMPLQSKAAEQLLDVGSGAGFPGIPLKIFWPQIELFLLDASGKKIKFLKYLVEELELKGVTLLQRRAEDLARNEGKEAFPWVTARALAPLVVAAELVLPMVQIGGYFWAFKGPAAMDELKEAEEIIKLCGGALDDLFVYSLPHSAKKRFLLIFKKIRAAHKNFPRKAGIPQKRPFLKK